MITKTNLRINQVKNTLNSTIIYSKKIDIYNILLEKLEIFKLEITQEK
jgi:hypothetical protein